ncbi:MAG: type VI secretion system protein TssA [Methylococcales bacterium]
MAIEIEKFVTEITPENICGDDLEYDAEFMALEQEVQGKEEQTMGDSVIEAEPPNWREVKKQAEKILARTRDLRVCVFLLKALTETEGILGLADGMALLKQTTEKFWQHVHPELDPDDDNDPTERINILMSLCDFDSFLKPLQNIPLVESKALGRFSLRDIQIANGTITIADSENESEPPQMAAIDAAFQDCDAEIVLATAKAIRGTQDNLNQMESFITDNVGINDAASFTELRTLLKEINTIISGQIEKLGLNDTEEESDVADDDSENNAQSAISKGAKPASGPLSINGNQDVSKALNLISEYYKKNEPSSPIPMMLERVSRLVGKNFMEVLQDIAPNGVEQVDFLRGVSNNDNDE